LGKPFIQRFIFRYSNTTLLTFLGNPEQSGTFYTILYEKKLSVLSIWSVPLRKL
jgi:hypothetical protein